MEQPLSTDPYKGVRDFYPAEWAQLQGIFTKIRQTLVAWGYEEYNASPLERAELYEAKTSEEIVREQTYTFTDRGDRRVTLRPEMTPTLARMVAAKSRELPLPLRWFSIGNRFRYERPQKGRLREFYQVDVDLIGLAEGEADIEILRIASAIMRECGVPENAFRIRLNSRALLTTACRVAGLAEDRMREYLRLLDKKAKMTPESFSEAQRALSQTDPLVLIESAEETSDIGIEKAKVLALIETLKAHGVGNVVFDTSVTRGFDYYTGIVFEVFDTSSENPRAMFGGGRYDNLSSLFGSDSLPAVGFGIGEVTFSDFLETHGLLPNTRSSSADVYLGTPTQKDIPLAQDFADTLRAEGIRVFVNLTSRTLGDQIKDAVKRGIPFFVAYGSQEQAGGEVRVKTLSSEEESLVPVAALSKHLRP
jgi:histidyl-tRNA synthetase